MGATATRQTTRANPSGVPVVKEYPIHPAAKLGKVDKGVLAELEADMAVRGYVGHPIKLLKDEHGTWRVIDGRHRQAVCIKLGIVPEYEFIEDITAIGYVSPYDYVVRIHHMRDIPRQVKMLYVLETRPELSFEAQIKIAGGGSRGDFMVMRKALKERPDLFEALKNRDKTKMTVTKIGEEMGISMGYRTTPKPPKLREQYEILEAKYTEAVKELRAKDRIIETQAERIALLERDNRELADDLASAEKELEQREDS